MFYSIIGALILLTAVSCQDKYTSKFDSFDVDAVITNERLGRNYVDCIVGKGSCTAEGTELKKIIPDALENECAKCSQGQREAARKVLVHLVKNKKDWFDEIAVIYDKDGVYRKKYEGLAKKEGIETL